MNSKTTGIWFVIAAALFAFIFVFERWFHPVVAGPSPLLPGLRVAGVTSVQVYPAISASLTNGSWFLTKPVYYPAQTAAITALLDALQKISPARLTASELREHQNTDADLGLENPQATLVINADGQSKQLKVGNKTALGDQVYLRVAGEDGVDVADAGWLNLIPRSADQWRDTSLVDAGQAGFDWIVLTNNARGIAPIELRRDATTHLWRMIRPLDARADNEHIADALQQLAAASATRFVTDDPNADLTAFGLQPADLDLWLGRGTNLVAAVHVGKSPTNDATQVYARREGWNTVLTTAAGALSPWRGGVNEFRDKRLFELTAPAAEIEVRGPTNHFLLRKQGSNDWQIGGGKFPVDAGSVQLFLQNLAGLRIADFVKDAPTATNLAGWGLAPPRGEIILRAKAGDTNAVIAELDFGAAQTNKIFARRPDENFVYAVSAPDLDRVFPDDWQFRDRRVWDFKPDDVAQITIHQNGKTRQIVHDGPGKWSLAAGSEGFIESKYIEQAIELSRQLTASGWFDHNFDDAKYGFSTNNLQVTFELKNGQKDTVDFGAEAPQLHTAVAAVTLDGARWAFLFPPAPYLLILNYLTIPPNIP